MIELMNGVSRTFLIKRNDDNKQLNKKFTVLYSGNMSLAQDLNTIIDAAHLLSEYQIFEFIGNGVCKSEIEIREITSKKNKISRFYNGEELIKHIKKSSVCLVPLKNKKLFKSALPSKMFEYMACSKPIILGVRGEAKKIISKAKCGICVEPENSTMLAEAILSYYRNQEKCINNGKNGFDFVSKNYSKEILATSLINNLKKH